MDLTTTTTVSGHDGSPAHRLRVDLGARSYDVVVGRGVIRAGLAEVIGIDGWRHTVVVTDDLVGRLHGAGVIAAVPDATVLEVPRGEAAKTLDTVGRLYRELAAAGAGRDTLVVAFGGGSVGDVAGFVAATWNRGVALLQLPTTVIAQADAAIGGKTAIDLPQGKNLVGAFHQPVAVLADVATLATLPPRDRAAGLAEVLKAGLVGDASLVDLLDGSAEAAVAGDLDLLATLIARAAAVKARVVSADEREAGPREVLNLGHTYGHAVEALSGFALSHGEAVAIGLLVDLRIGVAIGVTPPGLYERVARVIARLGLPATTPRRDRDDVWEVMRRDKKTRDGVRFVVVDAPGSATVVTAPVRVVDAAIDEAEDAG